ncbi:hypothetical protein [Bradyrhizobium sp.]|uniref:hypothetical protein n=1 Tax=Bradyrhizobium sp. TaxID=376 RepID=UPI003C3D598B
MTQANLLHEVSACQRQALRSLQVLPCLIDSRQIIMSFENAAKEHLILGTDARDIEEQKQRWLEENPQIEIIESGDVRREPASLLIRLGGKRIPRFSILLQYRETDAPGSLSTLPPSEQDNRGKNGGERGSQRAR